MVALQLALEAKGFPRVPAEALWRFRGQGCLAGIVLLVLGLYLPTLNDPFHGDDFVAFTDFGSKPGLDYLRDVLFFKDSNFYWRPLGCAFHFALYEVFGLDAFVFRLAGLTVFLLTLAGIYVFCLRERLGQAVALGAVLVFGLLPNHVVSVAWVTNTSRLMAVLFFLLVLIMLQARRPERRWWHETAAWLFFMAAILSDETTMALAPVPFLYATFVGEERVRWRPAALRLAAYMLPVLVLLPLQLEYTMNDEPRLTSYGLGPHVIDQIWALVSHLVFPLATPVTIEVDLARIPAIQSSVGLVAFAIGGVLFVLGSRPLKLLLVWIALALAPFTLWGVQYMAPRYVYMAALPYAIVLSWLSVTAIRAGLKLRLGRFEPVRNMLKLLAPLVLVGLVFISSQALLDRNERWSRQTERYGLLRESLLDALPDVPPHTRIIIYYGGWFDFWASSLVQGVYQDKTIKVINVNPNRVDSGWPPRLPNDRVVYFLGDRFVPVDLARQ
jgi:hypothetical protein